MILKIFFRILILNIITLSFAIADTTIFNYSDQSTYNSAGRISGNVGKASISNAVEKAKKICEELGFKPNTDKYKNSGVELLEIANGYDAARTQEFVLASKTKSKENINMAFSYESKSGEKVNKESKWNSFWKGAAWILYEHGEEIFNLALDLKYGTNYSGYNSTTKTNVGRSSCTAQRIGNVIHEHCSDRYCSYVKIGNVVHRNCRQK